MASISSGLWLGTSDWDGRLIVVLDTGLYLLVRAPRRNVGLIVMFCIILSLRGRASCRDIRLVVVLGHVGPLLFGTA